MVFPWWGTDRGTSYGNDDVILPTQFQVGNTQLGGFTYIFYVSSLPGEMIQFDQSIGLKPLPRRSMTCFVDVSWARRTTSWQRSLSCGFMTGVYVSHICPRHPRTNIYNGERCMRPEISFICFSGSSSICCFWEDQGTHQNHKYDMFFFYIPSLKLTVHTWK